MSYWKVVLATHDVQVSILTGAPQSATMNEQQVAPAAAGHTDRMNTKILPATYQATNANKQKNDNLEAPNLLSRVAALRDGVDMLHAKPLGIRKPAPNTELGRVSRYANLGLNARPLKFVGWKYPVPGHTVHTPIYVENEPVSLRKVLDEEVDMEELEAMLIPAEQRQANRERDALPIDPRSIVPNYSKYSSATVTDLGWRPVHNDKARVVRGPIEPQEEGVATIGEVIGHRDQTGKKLETKALVSTKRPLQQTDYDRDLAELLEEGGKPLVDEKYFVLENYLKHAAPAQGQEIVEHSDTEDVYEASTPAVALPESNAMAGVLKKRFSGNNEPEVKAAPDMSPPPSSPLSAVENCADIADEEDNGTEDPTSELTLWQNDKLELIGDNSDPVILDKHAPEKLTIRLRHIGTNKTETHIFQKLSHYFIDWSVKAHVQAINKWRYDIFSRRGIAVKRVTMHFRPEEDAWLMLFHKKLKLVVEAGHIIKMPGPVPTLEQFNGFFVGRVLQDAEGRDLLPREPRDEQSMKGKFQQANSGFKGMRDVVRKLLEGKKDGLIYVPIITEEELLSFQADGTAVTDDPMDKEKNAALGDCAERKRSSPKRKREEEDSDGLEEKRNKL